MINFNLAITSSNKVNYTDTFVKMQIDSIPNKLCTFGSPVAQDTIPGGPVISYKKLTGLIEVLFWKGLKGQNLEKPQIAELVRRFRKYEIDIVLSNYGVSGVGLLPVCEILSIPHVVHFHGYDAHKKDVLEEYKHKYRELGEKSTLIIAVSERMRRSLLRLGIPEDKIRLIRCGSSESFRNIEYAKPTNPVFFGVGRFTDKKAPYLTVLAFSIVKKKVPDATMVMGGDGDLLEATVNLADALGIGDSVVFPGAMTHDEVARQMSHSTAFVQHSITPKLGKNAGDSEGTPVAVIEALSMGLPVIASRHAGIGEIIEDRKEGLLFEEHDVDLMANLMLEVIEKPDLAKQMGDAAKAKAAQNFTSKHYIEGLEAILKEAMSIHAGR